MKLRAAESILENTFPDVDVTVEIDVAGAGARLPAHDEDPCSAEFLFTKQVVRSEFDAGKVNKSRVLCPPPEWEERLVGFLSSAAVRPLLQGVSGPSLRQG